MISEYNENPIAARRDIFRPYIGEKKYDDIIKKSRSLKRQFSILDREIEEANNEVKYLEEELEEAREREQYG